MPPELDHAGQRLGGRVLPRGRASSPRHGLRQESRPRLRDPLPPRQPAPTYLPDFILRIDDGQGTENQLNLIVEISGYPKGDKQDKVSTVQTYWLPGINALGTFGRWAFVEFTEVYAIEREFGKLIESYLDKAAA